MRRSLMILDDEPLVLNSLVQTIPWEELDCYVIGSAQNGVEGKRMLDALRPDILLTDIVMPGISGIELAEYCAARHPCVKVVLLSAHADFVYAQQAMRYGVSYYVLKPIDIDKLMDAVRKSKEELDNEQLRVMQLDKLEELAESARHLASTSLLFDIARFGNSIAIAEKDMLTQLKKLRSGVVIAIQLYNTPLQGGAVLPTAQKYYKEKLEAQGYEPICGSSDTETTFLCPLCGQIDRKTARERVLTLLKNARNGLPEQLGISVVSMSDVYNDFTSLHHCYVQSIKMLERGFFCNANTVLDKPAQESIAGEAQSTEEVLHHMLHGNMQELDRELNAWMTTILRRGEKGSARHVLRELHRQATLQASKAGMTLKPVVKCGCANENFFATADILRTYLRLICDYMRQSQNLVGRMRLFMDEHYANPELNLTLLSEELSANSSYLSRLFKKETSENFSDYLLHVRIENAQFLLETTCLKNSEIAKRVGFEDDHYFSQVFKKSCGLTPKQYRQNKKYSPFLSRF